jgi:hypothetical protein
VLSEESEPHEVPYVPELPVVARLRASVWRAGA